MPRTTPAAFGTEHAAVTSELPDVTLQIAGTPLERRVRVLLVDDHCMLRESLRRLLESEASIEVVGQAGDGVQAIQLVRHLLPDVVVMDAEMPSMDGVQATRNLTIEFPQLRVIGLSMHEHKAEAMLAAGAVAFLCKNEPPAALLEAICFR